MREITEPFKEEKNKKENSPIFLYTIFDYNGEGGNLCFAGYESDITYDGILYTRFPITHEHIGENTKGEIDTVKVTVSNVSRLIQAYLESFDFRGRRVSIKEVWLDKLDDPDAFIEDIYYIDNYTADQLNAGFTLTSKFDCLDLELPARKYSGNYCSWKFKSDECGYGGSETECSKTLARCRELSNQLRFGGFPSVPRKRMYIR